MSAFFISHSSADNAVAAEFKARLEERGHRSLFLDFDPERGIPAGRDWEQELYRQIRQCRAVIVLCSRRSVSSKWCFAEITHARLLGKYLIPVKLEECDLDPVIVDRQVIDLTKDREEGFRRLWRGVAELGVHAAEAFTWDGVRPPYPGMLAFEEEDAAVFFGRDTEIGSGLDLLNRERRIRGSGLILVLGASGSGKSSLVKAGIVPRLRRDLSRWLVVGPFRPRTSPMEELAAALSRAFGDTSMRRDWESILQQLTAKRLDPTLRTESWLVGLADHLRRHSQRLDANVVLVIDQFEELLGREADQQADRFLELVRVALDAPRSPLLVLATMRTDFLGAFQWHPVLRGMEFEKISLSPLGAAGREQIIVRPAEVAGVRLEAGLVSSLLEDAETDDALPLLAFTLHELYEQRGNDPLLTVAKYRTELGGLSGAVASAAEAVLPTRLDESNEQDLREAFLSMVRVNEDGRYVRQPVSWDQLPARVHPLLERFVLGRLLVSAGDGQARTLEVAHEALFRVWSRLAGWLDESKADVLLQQQVHRAATLWEEGGQSQDDLWRGTRLQQAQASFQGGRAIFSAIERHFIAESVRVERENRERQEVIDQYTSLRDHALSQYVHPFLLERKEHLQDSIAAHDPRNSKFLRFSSTAEDLKGELNIIDNFLGEGGRWHPAAPVHDRNLGPQEDYSEVYQFTCCDKYVLVGDAAPSQFRTDGCQVAPKVGRPHR